MEPPGSIERSSQYRMFVADPSLLAPFTALTPSNWIDEKSAPTGMEAMCVNGCKSLISRISPPLAGADTATEEASSSGLVSGVTAKAVDRNVTMFLPLDKALNKVKFNHQVGGVPGKASPV